MKDGPGSRYSHRYRQRRGVVVMHKAGHDDEPNATERAIVHVILGGVLIAVLVWGAIGLPGLAR